MAIYKYRCETCGGFEVARPMGAAPPSYGCVHCGAASPRTFSVPHLNRTPQPLADALTRAEKSRDEPEVVKAVPPRRRQLRPRAQDPRLRKLPRW